MSAEELDPADDADQIRLTLPAAVPYGRVTRLAVTSLASRNGYSYDDVEDLRIAVGELWAVLVEPVTDQARLEFTCALRPDGIEVCGSRVPARALDEITGLTRQILDAVVDEAAIDEAAGRICIVKRLHP